MRNIEKIRRFLVEVSLLFARRLVPRRLVPRRLVLLSFREVAGAIVRPSTADGTGNFNVKYIKFRNSFHYVARYHKFW